MTSVSRCPSCGQSIDIASREHSGMASCPGCGTHFSVLERADPVGVAVQTPWTPRGVSYSATTRKRPQRAPVLIVAMLGSAGLILAVVLAIASGWVTGVNSDRRNLSSANINQRKPLPPLTARPGVAARPPRAPRTQTTSPVDSVESSADPDREASAATATATATADDTTPSGVPQLSGNNANPAVPILGLAPSALADALMSAQRPVAAGPTGTTVESPTGGGTPKDYQDTMPKAAADGEEPRDLSLAEKRRLAEIAKLKKLIQRHFIAQRRTIDRTRGQSDDYFVVAKYEMPFVTRLADVRFEVSEQVDTSVDRVADYLLNTPTGTLRDFQVVARFSSQSDAEAGIFEVRQRYDQAREYQAQLLAFLQAQQRFQATSIRRC